MTRPKGRELAKLARAEGERFDCAPWVHKARSMPREEFAREVEKELTGPDSEPHEISYFCSGRQARVPGRTAESQMALSKLPR